MRSRQDTFDLAITACKTILEFGYKSNSVSGYSLIIAKLEMAAKTMPEYRTEEVKTLLAHAYYHRAKHYEANSSMQLALDDYQKALRYCPQKDALKASVLDCIARIKEDGLQVFTKEPPKQGVVKPVAKRADPHQAAEAEKPVKEEVLDPPWRPSEKTVFKSVELWHKPELGPSPTYPFLQDDPKKPGKGK